MKEISPLDHKIGELYIPKKTNQKGEKVGFVWEDTGVYRLATPKEILAAQQAEADRYPLVKHLSRRQLRQIKARADVRYLGQPRARY